MEDVEILQMWIEGITKRWALWDKARDQATPTR